MGQKKIGLLCIYHMEQSYASSNVYIVLANAFVSILSAASKKRILWQAVNSRAAAFAWRAVKMISRKRRCSPCDCFLEAIPKTQSRTSKGKEPWAYLGKKSVNRAKPVLNMSKIIRYVIIFISVSALQQSNPTLTHTSLAVSLPTWKLSAADGMSVLLRGPLSREICACSSLTKSMGKKTRALITTICILSKKKLVNYKRKQMYKI